MARVARSRVRPNLPQILIFPMGSFAVELITTVVTSPGGTVKGGTETINVGGQLLNAAVQFGQATARPDAETVAANVPAAGPRPTLDFQGEPKGRPCEVDAPAPGRAKRCSQIGAGRPAAVTIAANTSLEDADGAPCCWIRSARRSSCRTCRRRLQIFQVTASSLSFCCVRVARASVRDTHTF